MLSVVVNFFNNRREAQNTLHSLSRGYQLDAGDIPYEVIAVDNGSSQPLSEEAVRAFGPEFHYRYVQTSSVSPTAAINAACRQATGDRLLVLIDGAHIVSPGLLRLAHSAFSMFPAPFLATVSFHLGPKLQMDSVLEGYNQQVEDGLLRQSGWKDNGYRLFKAAGGIVGANGGWFGGLWESGCYGMRKADFLSMGGIDERFQSRGGGLVSMDFCRSALARPELQYVMLLGEGTFHQFHGGVTSNMPTTQQPWEEFHNEYVRIRGQPFEGIPRRPFFIGAIPEEALHIASATAKQGFEYWQKVRS
jgi:glycosyltransferase involved in cell wall biosynthesis